MNKNTLRVLSFVAGIILACTAVLGLFIQLGQYISFLNSGLNDSKLNAYQTVTTIKTIVGLAFYGFLSYKIIMHYLKNTDESKTLIMPVAIYFGFAIIGNIIFMCFYGFASDTVIVYLLLETAGLILIILSQFANGMSSFVKELLALIGIGLAFLIEFIALFNASGFGILICLLYISIFVLIFLYYLFSMLNENKNVQVKEEQASEDSTENA